MFCYSFAIGIVGDAGIRGTAQQSRLFVAMILILIFAEVLGLWFLPCLLRPTAPHPCQSLFIDPPHNVIFKNLLFVVLTICDSIQVCTALSWLSWWTHTPSLMPGVKRLNIPIPSERCKIFLGNWTSLPNPTSVILSPDQPGVIVSDRKHHDLQNLDKDIYCEPHWILTNQSPSKEEIQNKVQ